MRASGAEHIQWRKNRKKQPSHCELYEWRMDVNTRDADAVRIFIITNTSPESETERTFCFNVKLCAISWTDYRSLLAQRMGKIH